MELVCDEDIPRDLAAVFGTHDFTILDVRDQNLRGASDEAIFRFAAERHALLLTGDLGYTNPGRFDLGQIAGIIVNRLPQALPLKERVRELERLLAVVEPGVLPRYITVLEVGRMRRRRIGKDF